MSIVKLVVEDRPLVLPGIPELLCLMAGAVFGVWMLKIYATERLIVTNITLASIAFILVGFFASSTAITLYVIVIGDRADILANAKFREDNN